MSSHTRLVAAICAFGSPSAAASTIAARIARRCSVRPASTQRARSRRCEPVNTILSILVGDIEVLHGAIPIGHLSLIGHTPTGGQRHAHGGTITTIVTPQASTKTSLQQRLSARARERWPQLAGIDVRFRGAFAYVTGHLADGDTVH